MKKKKSAVFIFGCFFFIFALTSGCFHLNTPFPNQVQSNYRFGISVDSIAASDAHLKGKSYILSSGMKDIKDDDLQFKEFSKYIDNVLSKKGYTRVDTDKKADLLIRLTYGIGDPQTTSTTYTTSSGYSYPVGYMWFSGPTRTTAREIKSSNISLILEAYDIKTPNKQSQLWKTTAKSNSRVPDNEPGIFVVTYYDVSDIRIQIPYMIAASSDFWGENTGSEQYFIIMGDDPRVFEVMNLPHTNQNTKSRKERLQNFNR